MKKELLTANIMSGIGLLAIVAIYFLISHGIAIVLGIAWFVYVIYSNYSILLKKENHASMLRKANKHGKFNNEVDVLSKAYRSVMEREVIFSAPDVDEGAKKAYEMIRTQVISNVQYATQFMQTYDYISCPSRKYLSEICTNTTLLLQKLSEIVELNNRIDQSVIDEDITYIDDLIESLKGVLKVETL